MEKTIKFFLIFLISIFTLNADSLKEILGKEFVNFKSLSADFIQEKKSLLFEDILYSKGLLQIKQPEQLIWELKEPVIQVIKLNKNQIYIKQEDNPEKIITLNELPVMKDIFSNLSDLLQYKWDNIDSNFDFKIIKNKPFQIELTPRNKELKKYFKKITIIKFLEEKLIQQIEWIEVNGDSIKMIFSNIKAL